MRTLSTPDGALPIATSLTSQPVGPLNFDQSPPGSPTPTSARVTDPFAAHAGAPGRARPPATASPAPPAATRSRNSLRLTPGLFVPSFSMTRPSWSGGGVGFPRRGDAAWCHPSRVEVNTRCQVACGGCTIKGSFDIVKANFPLDD